jgi:hypothetical protein
VILQEVHRAHERGFGLAGLTRWIPHGAKRLWPEGKALARYLGLPVGAD